ncbi:hypothetical protein D1AOALGA4SA_8070 [Olavius algarvensis Delta 1 endosymbiont]|nr:hypothetical protein D1AOALGA4SA_8070 [Olavius algarvensis Delta 1 endosymbiont]
MLIQINSNDQLVRLARFLNDRIHYSMLDVQCSMFEVHFFL